MTNQAADKGYVVLSEQARFVAATCASSRASVRAPGEPDAGRAATSLSSQQLQGISSATIALRVYDKQGVANFGVNVFFDQITPTGLR